MPAPLAPLLSVVVPMFNVERYLLDCLESLAGQTLRDLEVVMVDDGSTDSTASIAAAFAARDSRFVLVRQPNGGLGRARNAGADLATGEYLAFVDSDDMVTSNAYRLLVDSLARTGSDFATGNYHRLTTVGTRQAGMVFTTFNANRPRTHVSRHPALLNDRTAWNKVFRRTFWDEHGFRWPEGVLYEDIAVTIPAHVLAQSVDVIREPVYLWRARAGDTASITQRRTEPRAIRDRYQAVDLVSRFLGERGQHHLKALYDRSVAAQDFRYFLQHLDEADDDFRLLFVDLANDFFDRSAPDVFDGLRSLERLEWHLLRRRLLPELLEVLRFEKAGEAAWTPVLRHGRKLYGDYPFRGEDDLKVPSEIYRLGKDELPMPAMIEDVWWTDDTLRLSGYAYIAFLGLPNARSGRIRLTLEESGRADSVVPLNVRRIRRPDVTDTAPDGVTNYDWSGWEATVPVSALRRDGRFRTGSWRLRVEVRAHGVTRRRWLSATEPGHARHPGWRTVGAARVVPTTASGNFGVEVAAEPAAVDSARIDGTVLELTGAVAGCRIDPAHSLLRVSREDGTASIEVPVATAGPVEHGQTPFVTRVDLTALGRRSACAQPQPLSTPVDGDDVWELTLVPDASGARIPLSASGAMPRPRLVLAGSELLLQVTRTGRVRVVDRLPSPEVTALAWCDDGALEISGRYAEPSGQQTDLVLIEAERAISLTVPMNRLGERFVVTLRPASMATPGGLLPLDEGEWGLAAQAADRATGPVRVKVDHAALGSLPKGRLDGWRNVALLEVDVDCLALEVSAALPASERARGGQRRLRSTDYPSYLRLPMRDQVLIDGYGRGRYGVDARAVHEELVARDTGLEVVWTTEEGAVAVPAGARAVPRHGREWYEAFARSRYVVMSDLQGVPDLATRPGQTVVQTWHGVPVTAIGLDDDRAGTRLGLGWQERIRREAARWDLVVSPGPAATRVLMRAFDPSGRIVETGLPRHDLLCSDRLVEIRAARAAAARTGLGISADRRVVLWAPTYRPGRKVGWLEPRTLADALGEDHVLVVRPHPLVRDGVAGADGRKVIDASWAGDVRDLLLIADVLVTDYSSLLVDFALTGRPMVFFTPDLDRARQRLYLERDDLPGDVVTDPAALAAAILAAPDCIASHDAAYRRLIRTHLPHADGSASARVVDAMLGDA